MKLQASGTIAKESTGIQKFERDSFNVASIIIAHLHNFAKEEGKSSPFLDLMKADRSVLQMLDRLENDFKVAVLLPHPYRDAATQVLHDFRLNKYALSRVFAFRSCQSMKHLDLWDESDLPPDQGFTLEMEENPISVPDETAATLDQSVALSKSRMKE
jgi:hypothetical protein